MEPSTAQPAAPAPPAASTPPPSTQSATSAALVSGSTSDYRAARRAERAGNPLPDVSVASAEPAAPAQPAAAAPTASGQPAAPAPPAAPMTRKEREQHEANERTRKAVESATADLQRELAELRTRIDRPAAPAAAAPAPVQPAAPAPPTEPAWKKYAAHPDAPKLAEFDSLEEHAAAMATFVAGEMLKDRDAAAAAEKTSQTREEAFQAQTEQYKVALFAAQKADPEFTKKVAPEVLKAVPVSGLLDAAGKLLPGAPRPTFANVVAEAGYRHPDVAAALYLHLSTNQAEHQRIARQPASSWYPSLLVLVGRLSAGTAAAPAAGSTAGSSAPASPKTLTDAPAPHASRGTRAEAPTDPLTAAIRSGDTRTYRELRRADRAAGRR